MDKKFDGAFEELAGVKTEKRLPKMFEKVSLFLRTLRTLHIGRIKEIFLTASAFSFSLLVSSAAPMAGVYPFGIALICTMSRFSTATAALFGALSALFFTKESRLIYGASVVSVYFVRLALGTIGLVKTYHAPAFTCASGTVRDSPFAEGTVTVSGRGSVKIRNAFATAGSVKMICALGGALTVGLGMILTEGNLWYDIFAAVFISVTVPLFTFAFSAASDEKRAVGLRKAGGAVFGYAFFLAIAPFTLGGMNVAVTLAFILSMLVSVSFGISDGILFGLFSGMAMEPAFAPMYAVAAAACGGLYCFSPGVASVSAAALGISWALYADGITAFSTAMPEILLAAGIFYPLAYFRLIPEKTDFFVKREEAEPEEKFSLKKRADATERIKKISAALSHMSKVLGGLSQRLKVPTASDCNGICSTAFAEVCAGCSKRKICPAAKSFHDGGVVRYVSASLKARGRVTVDTFPETMKRGCPSVDSVAESINREYGKFYAEALRTDKTSVIAEDYGNIAALVKEAVCREDPEEEKNGELTKKVKEVFEKNGIVGEKVSVYGRERPRIFVRGLTVKDLSFGSEDIRRLAEECVGTLMTEPQMSVDYDRLNLYTECRKKYSFKYGHYSERAGGPEVNGDAAASFVLPDGRFCMLICDGMGSGRDAALTARVSIIFLERMLTAGCPVAAALKLLNSFTAERRIECFSTVDLFIADPYTGKAEFIKSGAAPSFVLRGNKLFKMECATTPVGILKEANAGSVTFELEGGDYVIMVSDGISGDGENCAGLYDILCSPGRLSSSPPEAAREILHAARENMPAFRFDDATVGVVRCSFAPKE